MFCSICNIDLCTLRLIEKENQFSVNTRGQRYFLSHVFCFFFLLINIQDILFARVSVIYYYEVFFLTVSAARRNLTLIYWAVQIMQCFIYHLSRNIIIFTNIYFLATFRRFVFLPPYQDVTRCKKGSLELAQLTELRKHSLRSYTSVPSASYLALVWRFSVGKDVDKNHSPYPGTPRASRGHLIVFFRKFYRRRLSSVTNDALTFLRPRTSSLSLSS